MRRIPTDLLANGDRLGRDVCATPGALPLLRAGVRISDSYRNSLLRAGITSVWIDDGLSDGIEPLEVLEEGTRQQATAAIRDAFANITQLASSGKTIDASTADEMHDVAELIVRDVLANVHSALALNDLANADGYTLKHSLAVTTLGLSLGLRVMRKYGWVDVHGNRRHDSLEDRLTALGVGLLLHDIGKLAVPGEILRKPGPLTDDEWAAMRAHPTLGVQILLKADRISPLARAVVRSHHERWSGGGYPDGHSGSQIHQFARIAAVADVFDALTSNRYYRTALPAHEAYEFISARGGRDFDPEVVDVFQAFVSPYPPGTRVTLSDGRGAIVKDVRPGHVTTPTVRVVVDANGAPVPPEEIDMTRAPGVKITATEFDIAIPA
jgi:HD-GYP domain-containing protein (c-di-GMP phosphodiesterase class II)